MSKKVLFVGFHAFPVGFAQVERERLISKGLILEGYDVTVLNRYGVHDPSKNIPAIGNSDGINYRYASGSSYRESSYLTRNLLKFKGLANEVGFCFKFFKGQRKGSALLITTNNFHNVAIYALVAKLVGVQSILDNVEYFSSIQRKKTVLKKVNHFLYDKVGYRLVSKVIGISDFLVNVARKKHPAAATLKVPAIVDFSIFNGIDIKKTEPYFLYCGTMAYQQVIAFVLEAFEKLQDDQGFFLKMVCSNGSKADVDLVNEWINNNSKKDRIRLFSNLPYSELLDLYKNSKALLIPLRNNTQDIARFPHKIGEYSASASVIISTNIGEIKSFFTDEVNALLCDDYDTDQFSKKMQFIIDKPDVAAEIGKKGYLLGKENFDYIKLGAKIAEFISR